MTSKIILDNVLVKNNPATFQSPIELEITFTALDKISEPLEWKIIYVGSAKNEEMDQVLEEFEIGPIEEASTMKFTVDCNGPDYTKIPPDEIICVTALIITISYKGQEFVRVGYYVHNAIAHEEQTINAEDLTIQEIIKYTKRTILNDKPRITKFRIHWDHPKMSNPMQSAQENNSISMSQESKIRPIPNESEIEKQSTLEEKDQISRSMMKSEMDASQNYHFIESVELIGEPI